MSSKKDESNVLMFVFVIVSFALIGIAIIAYALFVALALLVSIWAIAAWNKPVTLFGDTFTPREARWYIARGIIGAYALPLSIKAMGYLGEFTVPEKYIGYIALGGYAIGSLGVGIVIARLQEEAEARAALNTPAPDFPPPPNASTKRATAEPFEYASWDD